MKKMVRITLLTFLIAVLFNSVVSAHSDIIPRESLPAGTPQEAIEVADGLISETLVKVQNGMGYADARIETNNAIFAAILARQTNGHGFGILTAIANNAIYEYRDIYLRPEYYQSVEETVKPLICDLISEVENGTKDYETARKEAYGRIYRNVNPCFNLEDCSLTDFCYWDVPAVDAAMFNRARKLLLEAEQCMPT